MSDLDILLQSFADGTLLRPSAEVPNLVDLARAMASLAGADVEETEGSAALSDIVGPSEHLVFVLVDGLGLEQVEALPKPAFLRSRLEMELRTVFPSTTAVALTSIATGEWPAQHGITGWWTHLPEIDGPATILRFTGDSDRPLSELGVSPEDAFPLPSLMSSVTSDAIALFPKQFADSVYSTYFAGGRDTVGYRSLSEAIDHVVARVRGLKSPTYTYLYTAGVDSAMHTHGTGRDEAKAAVAEVNRDLERLASLIDGRARVVVTADHGFLDAGYSMRNNLRPSADLMSAVRFSPSGDARVLYFHLRDGGEKRVREYFQRRYGSRFLLVTIDEAEQEGLFGPGRLSPMARSRLGDLVAISRGAHVIEYRKAWGIGRVMAQSSHHSGLAPAEMRVPLILA